MNKRIMSAACWFCLTLTPPTGLLATNPMDARLDGFFRDYLEASFRLQPMSATQLGDHRFDHLLEDLSPEGRKAWADLDRRTLEELPHRINLSQLSLDAKIDFEIFRDSLKRSIWAAENLKPFEQDPRVYNQYISDSTFLLLTQSTLPRETNISNCLARMDRISSVIAAARQNLAHPPRDILENAIRQNAGAISFYEKTLFELAGKTRQSPQLKTASAKVVAELKDYDAFLNNEILPRATDSWRLGREKFSRKLEMELDAGLSAEEVLQQAEKEFSRVQQEMYVIARQLWSRFYPTAPLPPDDSEGRRYTVQQVVAAVGQDHSTPKTLVSDVRSTVSQLKRFIEDKKILTLPEPDNCRLIEMPEFQRGNSTAYMNSPPPLDPKARGFFAVSPPPRHWDEARVTSYLEEYNRSMLQILTIHEAYPGHYVQFEYANRHPSLIRRVLPSGAYVEGWAVYTEQTLLDQGYGKGDLPLRLIQLKFYLRAVANAILDHKMHCSQMPDQEALDFLMRDAYQSEGEARLKVLRAKQSSVQLSTYFVGRMGHYRLRQQIQREHSSNFDLARYHEAVLAEGAVPMKFLHGLVQQRLAR